MQNITGVVACTCNPVNLVAAFRNGVGLIAVEGNSSAVGGGLCDHL